MEPNISLEVWGGMLVAMPLRSRQPFTLVGEEKRRHAMMSMGDVAAFAVAAVDHPSARNQTLVLGGPQAVSWRVGGVRASHQNARPTPRFA